MHSAAKSLIEKRYNYNENIFLVSKINNEETFKSCFRFELQFFDWRYVGNEWNRSRVDYTIS